MKHLIRLIVAAFFFTASINGPAPIELFPSAQAQAQAQQGQGGGGGEAGQIIAMLGMIAMMVMAFVMMGKKDDKPKDISCLVDADGHKALSVTGASGKMYTRPLSTQSAEGTPITVNPQMNQLCSNPALLAQLNQNLPNFNFPSGGANQIPVVLPPEGPPGLNTSSVPPEQHMGQSGFYDPQ